VFENRVLRRIVVLKGDEVTGGWRKLHSKEVHNLYSSNIFRMWWMRHVAYVEEMRYAYKILVGKPEGKRLLVRPRCRCEDNIKIEMMWTGFIWLRIGTAGRLL
jgi:hypothetical protein